MLIEVKYPKLTIMCRKDRNQPPVASVEYEFELPADEYGIVNRDTVHFWCDVTRFDDGHYVADPSVFGTRLYGENNLPPQDYIPTQIGMSKDELLALVGKCFDRGTGFYHFVVVK